MSGIGAEARILRGRRPPLAAVLLAIAAGLLCGCGSRGRSEELRVGLLAPLTGSLSNIGLSVTEGAELAVYQANRDGGLALPGGRCRVVLLKRDTRGVPEEAVKAASELINQAGVSALIGPPISRTAIPVARMADRTSVPLITPIATHPDVTDGTECVRRVCFTDDFQGEVMARFARETLGAEQAAVLFDVSNEYNRGIARTFKRAFERLGGSVGAMERYVTGEKDFLPHMRRIAGLSPDVLFLPNFREDVLMQVELAGRIPLELEVIGSDTMSFRNAEDIQKLEGAYFSTHFFADAPGETVSRFTGAYRRRFDRDPSPTGALTYDSFRLLFRAVTEEQSTEARGICGGLGRIRRFEGVTGIMVFDGSRDPRKTAVILHVEDGTYRFHTRIVPR